MAFGGFNKNSGPATRPGAPIPSFGSPTPSSHFTSSAGPPPTRVDPTTSPPPSSVDYGAHIYGRSPEIRQHVPSSNVRAVKPANIAEVPYTGRTRPPYPQSPDEVSRSSRIFVESQADQHYGNGSFSVPFRARSPPMAFPNNPYADSQQPISDGQQRPFSSPVWGNQPKSYNYNTPPVPQGMASETAVGGGAYHQGGAHISNNRHADVPAHKKAGSPTLTSNNGASRDNTNYPSDGRKRSLVDYRDLDAPEATPSRRLAFEQSPTGRASPSSPTWHHSQPSTSTSPTFQDDASLNLPSRDIHQPRRALEAKNLDGPFLKRTRSPQSDGVFSRRPAFSSDAHKRALDPQSHEQSSISEQTRITEAVDDKPMHVHTVKKTKLPLVSSSFEENLDTTKEAEREFNAKAQRLARFKEELSQPVNPSLQSKVQHQLTTERQRYSENAMADADGSVRPDYEGVSSSSIIGLCSDMCPESERAERERKGDLDQYERLDGDRNQSSEFLAVKKYTRTAEREAELIRPMPILQRTMDYLLNLLDQPYDDRFLSLYNFLWDRMRAIRMDLRMQHIFNLEAIRLLEQMIRLHIAAMHELCEYTRGEGFSEGFDAHLNIEQMNKTSVELFQLYDDHRKKGIDVPSEREFRGYYALLKLDKHPGYKVEPAELSLDLAKMTPDMRQSPEVLFARDVARACRAGNFIAFFRLARRGSYLQACLMHAHFSKLRTQALASLHSGLQNNQGIPVAHVSKWLGMEEDDIENLLEYHGFSVKDFREPYMMKENSFINVDNDYPVKHSKLVERKRSRMIVRDVSSPPVAEFDSTVKQNELRPKTILESKLSLPQLSMPVTSTLLNDEEMHYPGTVLSPKGITQNTAYKASVHLQMPGVKINEREVHLSSPKPLVPDFSITSSESNPVRVESAQKPMHDNTFRNSFGRAKQMHDPVFRTSFGRTINNDLVITPPITLELPEKKSSPVLSLDSGVDSVIPQPMFVEDLDEHTTGAEEDDYKVSESYYDKEIAEAKLKLILRIWKRRSAKKREMRRRKLLAANAALSSLLLGPPIWRSETQSDSRGTFNIDHIMKERHEIQERSLSLLNPSNIIAPKLFDKNPDAKCLCWKMVLCSQEKTLLENDTGPRNESAESAASLWLHSKLIPVNNSKERDLLISSHDLAIWKHWIPSQSGNDPICCLSVIKSTKFDDLTNSIIGTNAVLFLLSEHIPLELQKKRLHDIVSFLPSNSRLPLLILSDSGDESPAASTIANDLSLNGIDKMRVTAFHIIFLKNHNTRNWDGFFSNESLIEGLKWLATQSSKQIVVRGMKTRELVLACLNSTTEILDGENYDRVDPNYCISSFNEVLDQSINEVAAAARSNPTGWPCPEIELLDKSGYEYKIAAWYFPSIGWSSAERVRAIMSALNDSKLPTFRDDLSWLLIGLSTREDIENKKLQLANCLTNYLMEIGQMDAALVHNEVNIMLQKCTRLELHRRNFLIVPHWFAIFRRIYSWQLMNLTRTDISSVYVLAQQDPSVQNYVMNNSEVKGSACYVSQPSLDEMIEVSYIETEAMDTDHESFGGVRVRTCYENVVVAEDEDTTAQNGSLAVTEVTDRGETANALKASSIGQTDGRLSEMLKKCNMLQDLIDKKLSIYF